MVGLAGTVAGMLFAIRQIGTESEWLTIVEGIGVSLTVTGAIVIVLLAIRTRH